MLLIPIHLLEIRITHLGPKSGPLLEVGHSEMVEDEQEMVE